jgi:hypothetical protein
MDDGLSSKAHRQYDFGFFMEKVCVCVKISFENVETSKLGTSIDFLTLN